MGGTPKVARLPPPAYRIVGERVGLGRYALWTFRELATNADGTRYLCWLCSQRWFRLRPAYSQARDALVWALQVEGGRIEGLV